MADGEFKFEDCLLKHYIRKRAWLPACKQRFRNLQDSFRKQKDERRLRYFTFCAVGALDVVMLDMEHVIHRSRSTKRFDTVVFFDVNQEFVSQTQMTIPGAIGFASDFVDVVLANDPAEAVAVADPGPAIAPEEEQNTAATRELQRLRGMKRDLIKRFPFDVINLDIERYLFRPKERLPGNVIRAFRKIFEWQRLPGRRPDDSEYRVDEFTLMFTTRIGPPNLDNDYLNMLRKYVEDNLQRDPALNDPYTKQSGNRNPSEFLAADFESFFKLAAPKTIISLLWEEDWEIDVAFGVKVFEFERQTASEPYRILHFIMTVRRISPRQEERPPGQMPEGAQQNYREVIRRVFSTRPDDVAALLRGSGEDEIRSHLDKLKAYREKTRSR
jgi:hypothetical protein